MIARLNTEEATRLRRMSREGTSDKQLCAFFRISLSTVSRYKSEKSRLLSQEVVRNKAKVEKVCYRCGLLNEGHARCSKCEIMVHNDQDMCDDCLVRNGDGLMRASWVEQFSQALH